jgi:autotransporter-associated beta strand protein
MRTVVCPTRTALVLIAVLAVSAGARGQTFVGQSYTTRPATSAYAWSAAGNWSSGVAPTPGATTDLSFSSILDASYTAQNDIATPFLLRSVTVYSESMPSSDSNALTIAGPLQFAAAGATISDNGPRDVYFGTFNATAVSTVDLTGSTSIVSTIANAGSLRFYDQVTGSGSLTINKPSTNFTNGDVLLFHSASTPDNTFSGGVTLQAGILGIGKAFATGDTIENAQLGTGTLTIATTGTGLSATGELRGSTNNSTVPVLIPNLVTINAGATLTHRFGSTLVFASPISGAGGVSLGLPIATSTMVFEAANGYTGRTELTGETLTLRGTAGALTGSTQIELFRYGVLTLDSNAATVGAGNSAGNQATQNRIRDDAAILMHRAQFNLTANATANTTETLGTLTGDGWNLFQVTPQTNTGAALTVSNLVRANRGTFEVRGINLGGAAPGTANTANVILTQSNGAAPAAALVGGGGAAGSTNVSIIPFMTGSTAISGGTTLVTYDPTNGLRALNTTTEFAATPQLVPYAPGATNNVRVTSPVVIAGQPVTVNALVAASPTTTANSGVYGFGGLTGRVNVTSGAVETAFLAAGPQNYLNVAELNFGGQEAIITGNAFQGVINAAITNNTGLTVSGNGRTALMSPNSVINGPLTLNGGETSFSHSLAINSQTQLGGATSLTFNGGILNFASLATGSPDTLATPIVVNAAGASINAIPVGANNTASTSGVTLTGPITGAGPLNLNRCDPNTTGGNSSGVITLAGDASGYSGLMVLNGGMLQIDSAARLGTGPAFAMGQINLNQPATLRATATTAINKTVYMTGLDIFQVDASTTLTMSGVLTGSGALRKFGTGDMVLTAQNPYSGATTVGGAPNVPGFFFGSALNPSFAYTGGNLILRDQGTIPYSLSFTVAAGSSLVLDNTGSANLSNRINNTSVTLAGGTLLLKGATSSASTETAGPLTLPVNTGSIVEVQPGATQTASIFFSGPTNGGFVRSTVSGTNTVAGSTVTFRAPGLGGTAPGTGQINFIHNTATPTGPALTNGILGFAYGEDSATSAVGLVTVDTVPPTTTFPQYYRTRLLTAGEYTLNSFPDAGTVTTNHRQTAAAMPAGSPTVNSLFLDTGGSLTIAAGNTVTINSGTVLMAGGTSITGGNLAAATDQDLAIYVGSGTATFGSDLALTSSAGNARTFAKTGPGTLTITGPITGGSLPPGTIAVQRGTLQLGAGGSLPTSVALRIDTGATFDLNSIGSAVEVSQLSGLGNVTLGTNTATVFRVNAPSGANMIYGGTVSGTGTFEKAGAGALQLTPTANVAVPITLSGGTLQFGDFLSPSPVIPVVSGPAVSMGDGTTVVVTSVQDFQRALNVNVGSASATATLSSTAGLTTRFSGPISVAANKTLAVTTSAAGFYRFAGQISGAGAVTFNAGLDVIDGNNSYTGGTTIAGTTIGVGSDTAFGNSAGAVTVSSASSLFASAAAHSVANPVSLNADLTFGTPLPIYQGNNLTLSGGTTLGGTGTARTVTTTAAGRLSLANVGGSLGLTKAGGGTLELTGPNNNYAGATTVNGGTLLVNGTLTAGGGGVTINAGAFLGGAGTINQAVTVNAQGVVSPGNSPGPLTVNGNLTLSAASVYLWELGADTTTGPGSNWDQIRMTSGALSVLTGAQIVPAFVGTATQPNAADPFWLTAEQWNNVIDLSGTATNGGASTFTIDNSAWAAVGSFATLPATTGGGVALVWTPAAVPEPGSLVLVLAGAGLAAGARAFRRGARSVSASTDPT